MILIGQYDSPFVRRVGIALRMYRFTFEHRPWAVWRDAEKIAQYSPLRRVPVLVLDSGESLCESSAILDILDQRMPEGERLIAPAGPERLTSLRITSIALGLADKAVSLFYERMLHAEPSLKWIERCQAQIGDALRWLERERQAARGPFWFGGRIGHTDIAVGCALRFLREVHGEVFPLTRLPALSDHAQRCEALPEFIEISQPFSV